MSEASKIFKRHIANRIDLNDDEFEHFLSFFSLKTVKKRQFIIQPDFVPNHRNFVVQGAMRAYIIDDSGNEHTIQFAIDNWWITDYNAYIYQKPATMFVMAQEDTLLLQIIHKKEIELKAISPKFETFFRIMAERSTAYMQRRVIERLTLNAEERYEHFLDKYPLMAHRFPQYAIASYIGVTTEFLSRMRKNRLSK
ncbi:Crp/Fnr family transcriptional regulator [Winogradskyella sp.]|uniref:Crp/Fnr family transcriptional regulator n=1 Tax=Winogradskyella sp. TaxID=1883156 RepID=UPI00260A5F15|nr:Crp/Fnr family transcriptional regulator [Winogradskyella sp.]